MNEYAKQNAKGFLYPKETVLEDDYPVHPGYAYVAVFEDGEVRVVSSWLSGRAIDLKADLNKSNRYKVAEIRRCELVARMRDKGA